MRSFGNETISCFIKFQNQILVFSLPRISVDKCRNIAHVKSNQYTYMALMIYMLYKITDQQTVSGCY